MDTVIKFLKKIHAMKVHILTVGGPKESALSFLALMYKEKLDQLDKLKDKSKATVQGKSTISNHPQTDSEMINHFKNSRAITR